MTEEERKKLIQRRREKAIEALATYMGDHEKINRLIRAKELKPQQYDLAITLAIDDFNQTAPVTRWTLAEWPSLLFLLQAAAIQYLIMAGIIQSRNRLNYSAGGVSVMVSDKAQDYQSWIQQFVIAYERQKLDYKKSQNIASALDMGDGVDGLNSEYESLHGYYYGTW